MAEVRVRPAQSVSDWRKRTRREEVGKLKEDTVSARVVALPPRMAHCSPSVRQAEAKWGSTPPQVHTTMALSLGGSVFSRRSRLHPFEPR